MDCFLLDYYRLLPVQSNYAKEWSLKELSKPTKGTILERCGSILTGFLKSCNCRLDCGISKLDDLITKWGSSMLYGDQKRVKVFFIVPKPSGALWSSFSQF